VGLSDFKNTTKQVLLLKVLWLNHHRRDASDGGGASTRTGTGYRSNNIGDNGADNSPRSTPDKGRNKRARQIYQSTRPPSLFEEGKRQAQALTELGEDCFS
jgi:hypothetical protein